MTRRRLLWIGMGALSIAVAFLIIERARLSRSPPFRITTADVGRLHKGMSEAEVAAALGRPAGDYRTSKESGYVYFRLPWAYTKEWVTDEMVVEIGFDDSQRVTNIICVADPTETWWQKTKDRIARAFT